MGARSGAATTKVQNTATLTDLPEWYKALTEQAGANIGDQMALMPQINAQFLQGGTAPTGGVFTGGATAPPPQPALPPPRYTQSAPVAGGISFAGNGMGTGLGHLSGNTSSGAAFNQQGSGGGALSNIGQ